MSFSGSNNNPPWQRNSSQQIPSLQMNLPNPNMVNYQNNQSIYGMNQNQANSNNISMIPSLGGGGGGQVDLRGDVGIGSE